MEERFRFTGQSPPPNLLGRFPNWQNAYDEEGMPDQDESTIRPADNQCTIDDEVSCTAGDAILASGQKLPALLEVQGGELWTVYVYPEPPSPKAWAMSFHTPSQRWVAMNEKWDLQGEEALPVPLDDPGIFPIRVSSRLPLEGSSDKIRVEIAKPHQPRTAKDHLEKWKRRHEKRKR
jgi:hypothetical protein